MKTIQYIKIIFSMLIFLSISSVTLVDTNPKIPLFNSLPLISIENRFWPIHLMFCFLIIVITWYEVNHLRILDIFTLPGIIIALILSYYYDNNNFKDHFFGVFAASFPLYLSALIFFKLSNKVIIGGGVIKISAMIGAFIGVFNVVFSLVIATSIIIPYYLLQNFFYGKKYVEVGPLLSIISLTTLIVPYEGLIHSIIK